MAGWKDTIEYALVSLRPSMTVTWETRSIRESWAGAWKEQRRSNTVSADEQVEESRGIDEAAAKAACGATFTGTEKDNTLTVVACQRSNDANGFTVTKTTTRTTSELTDWADV